MSNLKRPATSPAEKERKKTKEDDCVICCEPATEDVLECNWCEGRLHAGCVKLSKEQCTVLCDTIRNVVFFCSPCLEMLPVALKYYDGLSIVDSRVTTIERSIKEISTVNKEVLQFSKQHQEVANKINELSVSTAALSAKVNTLIQDQSKIASTTKQGDTSQTLAAPSTTLSLADEITERERRKNNIVVYNLKEGSNRQADKDSATVLLNSILDFEVNITKLFRLGQATNNKNRPLLIGLESEEIKFQILAAAPRLRTSKQFPKVYISQDMTQAERQKHKQLVTQLKQRRAKGEQNIVIRNGRIITRYSRTQLNPPTEQSFIQPSSATNPHPPSGDEPMNSS